MCLLQHLYTSCCIFDNLILLFLAGRVKHGESQMLCGVSAKAYKGHKILYTGYENSQVKSNLPFFKVGCGMLWMAQEFLRISFHLLEVVWRKNMEELLLILFCPFK